MVAMRMIVVVVSMQLGTMDAGNDHEGKMPSMVQMKMRTKQNQEILNPTPDEVAVNFCDAIEHTGGDSACTDGLSLQDLTAFCESIEGNDPVKCATETQARFDKIKNNEGKVTKKMVAAVTKLVPRCCPTPDEMAENFCGAVAKSANTEVCQEGLSLDDLTKYCMEEKKLAEDVCSNAIKKRYPVLGKEGARVTKKIVAVLSRKVPNCCTPDDAADKAADAATAAAEKGADMALNFCAAVDASKNDDACQNGLSLEDLIKVCTEWKKLTPDACSTLITSQFKILQNDDAKVTKLMVTAFTKVVPNCCPTPDEMADNFCEAIKTSANGCTDGVSMTDLVSTFCGENAEENCQTKIESRLPLIAPVKKELVKLVTKKKDLGCCNQ